MGNRLGALSLLGLGLSILSGQAAQAACNDESLWLRGDWGSARFAVQVADDTLERARGLMFVEQMPSSAGMLFVYDAPHEMSFWMKNTLIPLDMVFADSEGVVISVHENAVPGDLTPIPSAGEAQYVLEINGGLAAQLGIAEGSEMQHPRISAAAWPCE
ncbi:DUF192 domain-containing protein [Salipiger sp. PrR002]|uniref:DUF192 domain-containing protein n=1 Tax=Salipiger sp. PrR002 TaxID=2706489 RepID=UPI0013B88043|nr:DUF192 domain-containing protein [Salipiger sp. PrR002]NDV99207.1 DUF192 domain-containing protein [Salipiger sp. PrR002]NDW55693.1 DUF192 domain-containing protein [Salipiger sp. PrR004]